jgi:peptidyl-prolyl cis-trans isomerase SurA
MGFMTGQISAQQKPGGKSAKSTKAKKQTAEKSTLKPGELSLIGPFHLTLAEYQRQYIKNNGGFLAAKNSTLQERKDFLDLLVKYRLKVLEARDRGYDKDSSIIAELQEYRANLAEPYLLERALVDPKVELLYNRRLNEVHVAHIVIQVPNDTTGKPDTVSAWNEALRVLALARSGQSFDSLATRYSNDPSTAKRGGDLGFFTAGMTSPSFDEALFELKPGEIASRPQRTPYGYHIVKLLEKIPAREIEISHILIRFAEGSADTAAAYGKVMRILDSLKNGTDFKELAMRNSEDPYSGGKGGDLGFGRRRRFVPEFENVAFTLKPGQYSGPVRTGFGYHIIKVTGERNPPSIDESRQEMKDLYRKYGFNEDKASFIKDMLAKHNVHTMSATIEKMAQCLDTTATTAVQGWPGKLTADVLAMPLIQIDAKNISVDAAVKNIMRNRELIGKPLNRKSLAELKDVLAEKEAWQAETADLEKRYPEFADLMQEYQEGVLLFRAEQEEVWNKVAVNDTALKAWWSDHKADFRWPDRVRFSEIFVTSDSLSNMVLDSLRAGKDFGELASRHTQRSGYKDKQGDWGFQSKDANELAKKAWTLTPGHVEGPMKFQYGFSIFKVAAKDNAREKTFEEASSEASSKFQEFESKRLEKAWVERLKVKFGVRSDDALLEQAFKDLK